ncbi:response regulator transcription factor [Mucilaginibacter sabulilitoris]|uniref:Response regulator transcription factor n=1 Tax=Mucilaginibacter sabulilitoris TaxID=1173583 RepID=A0ABZ0TIQ5_9SPHI|nr:response regulator transcription factor [Mucilaginibacter sabulilitoris]WPU92923.1 response regulator transcription factor [Mucilaginibacter sabulilitoris]
MDIRVSVFDDNSALRDSLSYLISGTPGYVIAGTYPDGNKVLDHMRHDTTDVVLMDIDMPGLSGIEATALIKTHFPNVNVLILTSYDDSDKVFAAIQSGATGYLLKKTSPAKILEAITDVNQGGAPMNASIARKVLDFFREKRSDVANEYDLSLREREVLGCLVKGDSYKMIAERCYISMGTVCTHISSIYKKLHVNSKSEAVAKAIRERLVGSM